MQKLPEFIKKNKFLIHFDIEKRRTMLKSMSKIFLTQITP